MRNWSVFIFRHILVFLGVTLAGSFLPGFIILLPAIFRGEISLDGVRAFAALMLLQHQLIAPSVIVYVPIALALWKKGRRDTGIWAVTGALSMLIPAAFMIMAIGHFKRPPNLLGMQGASIAGIYLFVGFCLGAMHILTLAAVNNRWLKHLTFAVN